MADGGTQLLGEETMGLGDTSADEGERRVGQGDDSLANLKTLDGHEGWERDVPGRRSCP